VIDSFLFPAPLLVKEEEDFSHWKTKVKEKRGKTYELFS
jgi:hypothetical protein